MERKGFLVFSSKLFRVIIVLIVLLAGLWLLIAAPTGPGAETVGRQNALQGAIFAPAGTDRQSSNTLSTASDMDKVDPVIVDLAAVEPGIYDPNNQYDRWQSGEIDLDEQDGIISELERLALQEEALKLAPSENVQQAHPAAPSLDSQPGVNFDSIDYTECCGGGGNVPPDPELAVGPNHIVAVVNVAFEIYDKNGNSLVAPTTFASFFSSNQNCSGVFDPNALYDEQADRYIMGIDADGRYYCLAVSNTSNPTGSWSIYAFPTASGNEFFDYPHAGVGNDAIYMGANMFYCTFVCNFLNSRVWAFDKWAIYNQQSAAFVSKNLGQSEDTPQPLNLHGWNQGTWPGSGPHYILTETNYDGASYSVFAWNTPFGANTLSTVGTFNLVTATGVSAGMPLNVPQFGSSALLQANDYRPQDFEYRNGYAWTATTIACNPGGGTVNCVRWAQIDPAAAAVVDAGVYASNGEYRTFADLAVNHCDDMGIGYTKSSSSIYPSIWYTGRESGDPAGTLQAEVLLKSGQIPYTAFDGSPHRWGDYTEMTIGPDGLTFWYLGEYSKNTGTTNGRWGTHIGSFSFNGCTVDTQPTPTPANSPTPTNTPAPTATSTPLPTPTNTPEPDGTMHVGDLDGSSTNNGSTWTAHVTILIVDSAGNPVSDATVSGSWSNGGSGSSACTTNSSGQCTVSKPNIRKNISSVTFTVTNAGHSTLTYNAADNTDPDGDSTGTTINVFK
jgi:hypothetical protein